MLFFPKFEASHQVFKNHFDIIPFTCFHSLCILLNEKIMEIGQLFYVEIVCQIIEKD